MAASVFNVTVFIKVQMMALCLTHWGFGIKICVYKWTGSFRKWLAILNEHFNGMLNTLRPRLNGRHFPDDTFKWIFLNENVCISIRISLMFVLRGLFNNIPSLVQVTAWRQPGDKPLSEVMMRLPTHISVTRPQRVKHYVDDSVAPLATRISGATVMIYGCPRIYIRDAYLKHLTVQPWPMCVICWNI